MILGIGTDVVQIPRVEEKYSKYGNNLAKRLLGSMEYQDYLSLSDSKKVLYLSGRFAGKEAVAKALGTGIGKISYKEIEITNNNYGKPEVRISKIFSTEDVKIEISLAHDYPIAMAFAIIFKPTAEENKGTRA